MVYAGYRNLEIYKLARLLAIETDKISLKLPKCEMYEEGSQVRRSSKSIVSNIFEGFGRRRYKQEFSRFLTFALASCDETRDHIDMLFETKSLKDYRVYDYLCEEYNRLGKMIRGFIKSVDKGHKT